MNQLAWLVYGNKGDIIDEARCSILSALYHSTDEDRPAFVVITDTPEAFVDLPVTPEPIDKDELREWFGQEGYRHRSKPHALLKILHKAEKTVLVDSDTIFKKDPSGLFDKIRKDTVLVENIEDRWDKRKEEYYNTCYDFLSSTYGIDKNLRHINSGLIGLTPSHKPVIQDTIKIIDQIYTPSGRLFHVEQFSLAVALTAHNLRPIRHPNILHHYWSQKNLYRAMAQSFMNSQSDLLSDYAKQDFLKLSFSIPKPPWYYRWYCRLKAKRLKNRTHLRQFYLLLTKALYPYKPPNELVQTTMISRAITSLNKRNPPLYGHLLAHGIESLIPPHFFHPTSVKKINEVVKNHDATSTPHTSHEPG